MTFRGRETRSHNRPAARRARRPASWAWGFSIDGLNQPGRVTTLVAILSAAICVTMFALGFGVLIPISGALSSFADLVGVASAMVALGLLFG